jgi:hypothetical protein
MKFECQVVASELIPLTLSLLASCITCRSCDFISGNHVEALHCWTPVPSFLPRSLCNELSLTSLSIAPL